MKELSTHSIIKFIENYRSYASFEVFTVIMTQVAVVWIVTLHRFTSPWRCR